MPSDDSIHGLRLAIAANPNDPFAWYALGVRCYTKKLNSEAMQCFEKAESCKTNFSASNFYYIALTARKLGRQEECVQNLRKAAATRAINTVDKKARALAEKMLNVIESKGASPRMETPSPRKDLPPSPTPK